MIIALFHICLRSKMAHRRFKLPEMLTLAFEIPLVLAWAMSIHKAQGQTIQRVKVDLNKVFEKGAFARIYCRFFSKTSLANASITDFTILRPELCGLVASRFSRRVTGPRLRPSQGRCAPSCTGMEQGPDNGGMSSFFTWYKLYIIAKVETLI